MEFLNSFVASVYFWPAVSVWLAIDLLWVSRWRQLLARVVRLLAEPVILYQDPEPDSIMLYPRRLIERLMGGVVSVGKKAKQIVASRTAPAFDSEYPHRTIGYVVLLGVFIICVLGIALRPSWWTLGGAFCCPIVGISFLTGGDEFVAWELLSGRQTAGLKMIARCSYIVYPRLIFSLMGLKAHYSSDPGPISGLLQAAFLVLPAWLVPTPDFLLTLLDISYFAGNISGVIICLPWVYRGVLVIFALLPPAALFLLLILVNLAEIVLRVVYIAIDFLVWFFFTPLVFVARLVSVR
mgnify:CR=1 FL=1